MNLAIFCMAESSQMTLIIIFLFHIFFLRAEKQNGVKIKIKWKLKLKKIK